MTATYVRRTIAVLELGRNGGTLDRVLAINLVEDGRVFGQAIEAGLSRHCAGGRSGGGGGVVVVVVVVVVGGGWRGRLEES